MRRVVFLAVLTAVLPIMAFANSTLVFSNSGGGISSVSSSLKGNATLTGFVSGGGTISGGNLGKVTYQTGTVTGHTVTTNTDSWTFAGGGSFKITSNGSGIPSGTVFHGTFTGPVTFVGTFNASGDGGLGAWTYTLTGNIAGNLGSNVGGGSASGGTVQFTFDVHGHVPFSTFVRGNHGTTTIGSVPEPGTLGLLGTGLVGIAGLVRRKFRNDL